MDKDWSSDGLPKYSPVDQFAHGHHRQRHFKRRVFRLLVLACLGFAVISHWRNSHSHPKLLSTERLQGDYDTCASLRRVPSDPSGDRERNARFVEGQNPILIRNATVWTGKFVPVFECIVGSEAIDHVLQASQVLPSHQKMPGWARVTAGLDPMFYYRMG